MRILLTGTTGQVGGALYPLLRPFGPVLTPTREAFDLSRPASLPPILDELMPQIIVNPAAYTAVDRAEDESELAFRVNAESPKVMADWAMSHGVPLVHFSTDYVFSGSGDRPWHEDSPTEPLSVYGESKLAGEIAIRAAGGPHLILRTSWVYAAEGTNFLRTIGRLASEREQLQIVADQVGAPTSAAAIAAAVVKILQCSSKGPDVLDVDDAAVVNVACSGETTWFGFASAIVEGLRGRGMQIVTERIVPITTREYSTRAKRPANSRLDLARLSETFGVFMPDWREALSRELDIYAGLA
jgi:dTDP-4-dehydrorhamnose reductase